MTKSRKEMYWKDLQRAIKTRSVCVRLSNTVAYAILTQRVDTARARYLNCER